MKTALLMTALCLAIRSFAGEILVQKVSGDVSVRHGVMEVWTKVASGDALRPDDTMKTGKKGSALIVVAGSREGAPGKKTIALPGDVMVDLSDIRELSQEDLMLKLTMEKVRSSSYQWKNDALRIPNAAVVHGENRAAADSLRESDITIGRLELNGARVLFDNGFFATCALKGMQVFRQYPRLSSAFQNRLLVAEALEKANLRGEAISEYGAVEALEGITPAQQALVHSRIESLRR